MKRINMITSMAVLVAIGTIGSQFLWFPAGIARAYPVQHAVNVIAAILLGPGPAVLIAFMIGLIRNMLGIGSLLAFPGGMIGALLAGLFYKYGRKPLLAAFGEILGTGIIASLLAIPFAKLLMDSSFGALFFMPPFLVSSIPGALIGLAIAIKLRNNISLPKLHNNKKRGGFE